MEHFNCYICMSDLRDAHFCNKCSKLACKECLLDWLRSGQTECSYCRQRLSENDIVKCRWVTEIVEEFKSLTKDNVSLKTQIEELTDLMDVQQFEMNDRDAPIEMRTLQDDNERQRLQLEEIDALHQVSQSELNCVNMDLEEKNARIGELELKLRASEDSVKDLKKVLLNVKSKLQDKTPEEGCGDSELEEEIVNKLKERAGLNYNDFYLLVSKLYYQLEGELVKRRHFESQVGVINDEIRDKTVAQKIQEQLISDLKTELKNEVSKRLTTERVLGDTKAELSAVQTELKEVKVELREVAGDFRKAQKELRDADANLRSLAMEQLKQELLLSEVNAVLSKLEPEVVELE